MKAIGCAVDRLAVDSDVYDAMRCGDACQRSRSEATSAMVREEVKEDVLFRLAKRCAWRSELEQADVESNRVQRVSGERVCLNAIRARRRWRRVEVESCRGTSKQKTTMATRIKHDNDKGIRIRRAKLTSRQKIRLLAEEAAASAILSLEHQQQVALASSHTRTRSTRSKFWINASSKPNFRERGKRRDSPAASQSFSQILVQATHASCPRFLLTRSPLCSSHHWPSASLTFNFIFASATRGT